MRGELGAQREELSQGSARGPSIVLHRGVDRGPRLAEVVVLIHSKSATPRALPLNTQVLDKGELTKYSICSAILLYALKSAALNGGSGFSSATAFFGCSDSIPFLIASSFTPFLHNISSCFGTSAILPSSCFSARKVENPCGGLQRIGLMKLGALARESRVI